MSLCYSSRWRPRTTYEKFVIACKDTVPRWRGSPKTQSSDLPRRVMPEFFFITDVILQDTDLIHAPHLVVGKWLYLCKTIHPTTDYPEVIRISFGDTNLPVFLA